MKKYSRIFNYLRHYKGKIVLYFFFTILSIVFSLVSLGTLPFFLRLIFSKEKVALHKPDGITSSGDLIDLINYNIGNMIAANGPNGHIIALGFICAIVIVTVFLKNLFQYL